MRLLPNILTWTRVVLAFALVPLILLPPPHGPWIALTVFIVAASSDYFDGLVAKTFRSQSSFGRILDPIADKILVSCALLTLASVGIISRLSLIPAVIILAREFLISSLREAFAGRLVIHSSNLAKWKTAVQMFSIGVLITLPASVPVWSHIALVGYSLLWISSALAVVSAFSYAKNAAQFVNTPAADIPQKTPTPQPK